MDFIGQFQPNQQRICFFGDSITAHGFWIREVADFLLENHFDKKILPFNCGVPGDSADNSLNRIFCDCGCYFPSVAVVMFGMNDIGRDLYSGADKSTENASKRLARIENYQNSLEKILNIFESLGTKVILCTPTPYDVWQNSKTENLVECNDGLSECRNVVLQLADKNGLTIVDFQAELLNFIKENPQTAIINDDRVHPNALGHHLMAQIFLKTLGLTDEIDYSLPKSFNEHNQKRFETEEILRKISFEDWCLNYNVLDDWETAHQRIIEKLDIAKSWNDEYVNDTVELYLQNKNNQDRLRGKLIQQTIDMYC